MLCTAGSIGVLRSLITI